MGLIAMRPASGEGIPMAALPAHADQKHNGTLQAPGLGKQAPTGHNEKSLFP